MFSINPEKICKSCTKSYNIYQLKNKVGATYWIKNFCSDSCRVNYSINKKVDLTKIENKNTTHSISLSLMLKAERRIRERNFDLSFKKRSKEDKGKILPVFQVNNDTGVKKKFKNLSEAGSFASMHRNKIKHLITTQEECNGFKYEYA